MTSHAVAGCKAWTRNGRPLPSCGRPKTVRTVEKAAAAADSFAAITASPFPLPERLLRLNCPETNAHLADRRRC